jgi:site-specific recombinase XerD
MPKYASVYARARSPYWWVAYWDPRKGKRVGEATPYRVEDFGSKRKALALATEKSQVAHAAKDDQGSNWEEWVEQWLQLMHRKSQLTLTNYLGRWSHLREYLHDKQVFAPRYLTFEHCMGYVPWRTAQVKKSSGKRPTYNTALHELGLLRRLMREAVRRGYADFNPAEKMGLKKDTPAEKPEITDEEAAQIREALKTAPEWMQVSFEIAMHQGCRLKETQVPLSCVDLESNPPCIQFHAKHGKIFTTRLHPALIPMMKKFKQEKRKVTCVHPPMAAKEWHFFFKDTVKLPHLCFHCTRVTVVTKMARAGVPIQKAMAYVGHASEVIPKVYQRLKPSDVDDAIAALSTGGGR